MEKTLLSLLAFISFSAFAGDMYFVCEDEINEDFISVSINEGRARLLLSVADDPFLLDLKQVKAAKSIRYDLKVTSLKSKRSDTTELKIFEEVQLGSYICLVRD